MKLFVSYARVDKPLCKQVVNRLEDVHEVWYDKRLHAGMDWWNEIQERLAWCEGFVYLLSPESVVSEYCQKEYAIAVEAGKHIFPVLIQARTEIPESLSHIHFADLSQGMEDIITLMNALTIAERRQNSTKPVVKAVPKVEQPSKEVSPALAVGQAADALEIENYDKAVFIIKQALEKKPQGRVQRMLQSMLTEAEAALEKQAYLREAEREYTPIRELILRPATRTLGCEEFAEFQREFPDYDPDNVADLCLSLVEPQPNQTIQKQSTIKAVPETPAPQKVKSPAPVRSIDILPAPFEWIEIPGGQGTMKTNNKDVVLTIPMERYWIAKYPVTNGQFAKFIEAGGYKQEKWWTDAGWAEREKAKWTQPRNWTDSKWKGAEHPVVGLSWYESVAFCLWLSDITGEKIMLPTEDQWQYAAQGDDGRAYPWGNEWDASRCNNHVDKKGIGKTTPVTQYEGKGDSPFGVVDMAGNVWEWCLTAYKTGSTDLNSTDVRVLRGGSWYNDYSDNFRCVYRDRSDPVNRGLNVGFRLALS